MKFVQMHTYFTAEGKKILIDTTTSTEEHLHNQQQENEKGDIQLHPTSPSANEDYAQLPSPTTGADVYKASPI